MMVRRTWNGDGSRVRGRGNGCYGSFVDEIIDEVMVGVVL